jgi:hypothetical protein
MNIEAEKSELIDWITRIKDHRVIREILLLKKKTEKQAPVAAKREFGGGKHIFTNVAEDFNEPLDDFKEYTKE